MGAGVQRANGKHAHCTFPSSRQFTFFFYSALHRAQLGYLSLLALLSDWVCFSVAAAPETWEAAYSRDPATLIDIFLFTNVLFCFLEPMIVRRAGLRATVIGAATAMAAGCALRSGLPTSIGLQPYNAVVAGTVLVGAAQPMFQCTPPLLSATWFGADERALATAVAINFNQVGIATAFLVGGTMATSQAGLGSYFNLITIFAAVLAAGTAFQFRERPPTPPTGSAAARLAEQEAGTQNDENFLVVARQLLRTPGFLPPLCAFVASIGISNVVSAFVDESLKGSGFTNQATIDLVGAGFQAAIVAGGIFLGGYVDRTKEYKQTTLFCLAASFVLLLPFGLDASPHWVIIPALLALGALVGPVQPINAELAVEVAYPADENSIEALQQLCGNLFSALLVPVAERAADVDLFVGTAEGIHGDTVLLGFIALGALGFFNTFDAELKRSELDCASDPNSVSACDVVFETVPEGQEPAVGSTLAELLAAPQTTNAPPPPPPP